MKKIKLLLSCIATLFIGATYANNLQLSDLTINAAGNAATFNIQWDNSWYFDEAPNNWDAVWVFIKSNNCEENISGTPNVWNHVNLSTTSAHHSAVGTTLQVDAVSDGVGVFIRRVTAGTAGNIPSTSVTLRFANTYDPSIVSFQVMGIEMVAVLDGSFKVGGFPGEQLTTTSTEAHHSFRVSEIADESEIPAGTLRTEGTGTGGSWPSYHPVILGSFPKGTKKFYVMKYQVSQEQYVSFLNMLSYNQQVNRGNPTYNVNNNGLYSSNSSGISYRNGIKVKVQGSSPNPAEFACNLNNNATMDQDDASAGAVGDGQNIACNYLSWRDLCAYLDWSGLRPMTELEYEKAARGPLQVVAGEYAWGNANISQAAGNAITDSGKGSEISNASGSLTPGNGLAAYGVYAGPLRVGFPGMAGTDRVAAGASYWGVMELSGNLWEQTYSVGSHNTYINTFDGSLGDGELNANGTTDQADWPLTYEYVIVRGGSYGLTQDFSKVASRYYVRSTSYVNNSENSRYADSGGRGVRQF